MTDEERREEAEKVADFRYGLIAEFANPYLNREERRRMLAEKARLEYEVPGRGRRRLTAGCFRKCRPRPIGLGSVKSADAENQLADTQPDIDRATLVEFFAQPLKRLLLLS